MLNHVIHVTLWKTFAQMGKSTSLFLFPSWWWYLLSNSRDKSWAMILSVSSLLDSIGVPNLLWGNYLPTVVEFHDCTCQYSLHSLNNWLISSRKQLLPFQMISSRCLLFTHERWILPCRQISDCLHLYNVRVQTAYEHLNIDDEITVSLY